MFQGKNCLVVGCGISGVGAVEMLAKRGAKITFYDSNEKLSSQDLENKISETAKALTACITGPLPKEVASATDVLILSPGVPTDLAFVNEMRDRGVQILGEIELGFLAEKGKVIAITGTNGKTTTTTLMGEIIKAYVGEENTFVVGNIGTPYTLKADLTHEKSVSVAEISSFQLETIDTFKPAVSAILNVTPDHLNRHHTMEAYVAAKELIAKNQTSAETCVLNYDNPYTREFGARCSGNVVFFSSHETLEKGYYLEGEEIVFAKDGTKTPLLNIYTDMNLVGLCNVENVCAAIAMATAFGVPMDVILKTIKTFKAVEHRIEYVAEKNGVIYYNDSKGTNPDAAIQGIRAMARPTVLIGGGYDKQSEYDEWIEAFEGKVKALVLIGQTKEKIAACAKAHGFEAIYFADTYEECLELCTSLAAPGDAVLLSPACASWGMFPNYEERGRRFKAYVNALP